MVEEEKRRFKFPTAFTVLFIILVIAAVLTYIVPAGSFERLEYQMDSNTFTHIGVEGDEETIPATQEVLDEMGITIPLENFQEGKIFRPVAIPNTYQQLEQKPQGFLDILLAPIRGIEDSIGIITFVLIMGGLIELLNETGAFAAGIEALSQKTKGKEFFLVAIITILVAIGGTTFGFAEETIAFYPILMPIFLVAGFDAMVGVAAIYIGSCVGTMFSTFNPFSVVVASNASGINFTEGLSFRVIGLIGATLISLIYMYYYARKVKAQPEKSVVADNMPAIRKKFLEGYDPQAVPEFNWHKIIMLLLFASAFIVMIWGVTTQDWWFSEMSALFLFIGIIMMFVSGLGEERAVSTFLRGAASLVSVALIVGVARGINFILDDGMISDTLLNQAALLIGQMNGVLFAIVQMILFNFLGIFIPSSSGLAALSMPIIAPLADVVNVSRDVVVSAYNYGQGLMAFITPTGLILASLQLADVTYDRWLKWVLPLMGIIGVFAAIMLGLQVIF